MKSTHLNPKQKVINRRVYTVKNKPRLKWKQWVLKYIWVPTGWMWALKLGRRAND